MPAILDDALCIRRWDWSETSQTVSLLTRRHGIVRGVAKGSKRDQARFSGGIELLTRGELGVAIRAEGLATLTSWDLREVFPGARRAVPAYLAAMGVADVLHHTLREHDPHPRVLDDALDALRRLDEPGREHEVVGRLLLDVLRETGHAPELDRDARSGRELSPAPVYAFDPRAGGLTAMRDAEGAWGVRADTIALLRAWRRAHNEPPAAGEADHARGPSGPDPETSRRAARLLSHYLREVIQADPPALRVFLGP